MEDIKTEKFFFNVFHAYELAKLKKRISIDLKKN